MKINKIIAGIMAVCVMGIACPSVTGISDNTAITAKADLKYNYGCLEYINYGDYIEISGCDDYVTDVVIPSEIDGVPVTSIGDSTFSNCSSLTLIEIPNSVTNIGTDSVISCSSLTSINVSENNSYYSSENGVLFNKDKTELIKYPNGKTETEYIIPDSVTSIGGSTFIECTNLTSITIPNSVTEIGDSAFMFCGVLKEINIPDSVTEIGNSAFMGCIALEEINIPDSVTEIGGSAFMFCEALEEINIPNNVKYIYSYTFRGCTNLIKIIIPNSVISIDSEAFHGCKSLTEITIPKSVTSIGDMAFFKCSISSTILNSECEIGNYNHFDYIYGYENSTAQTYAEKNNCKFESLEEAPEKETATGDINGDGEFNIADAVILQKYLLGDSDAKFTDWQNADLCADGRLDVFDLCMMKKKLVEDLI